MTKNNVILTEEQKQKKDKEVFRVIVLLCVAGVIFIALCIGSVFLFSQTIKYSEEYAAAHEYLVNHEEFRSLGVTEDDVRLINYSVSVRAGEGDASFTFKVSGEFFTVVCHLEDGVWSACEQCSSYQSILDHHYITEDEI